MIDHLLGRPSTAYKRTQTLLVLAFWTAFIARGNRNGPPLIRWLSNKLRGRLTPWQVLAATLTCLYAVKNADNLLGLSAPEPLARLYSRDFYRATWLVVALDSGFATAMHVKPKWLRDFLSVLFSGYYVLFAHEADEKLRKYRAVCTVEMLRATWEKTSNPILRAATYLQRPRMPIKRRISLPRPAGSPYSRPVIAWLYFTGSEAELARSRDLLLDIPGGGFVCMDPSHHEDRILHWAKRTARPVLALDYSKAPEYPYPYALHECFDVYRLLHETKGSCIGFVQGEIRIVMSGDSAGANIGAATMIKLLEIPIASRPPMPLALIWTYPALDFNFTSFMPPEHLQILRQESTAAIRGVAEQKDHLKHQSPLAVVDEPTPLQRRRRKSWSKSFSKLPFVGGGKSPLATPTSPGKRFSLALGMSPATPAVEKDEMGHEADGEDEADELLPLSEREKSLSDRVQYWNPDRGYAEVEPENMQIGREHGKHERVSTLGTRLTMTSRTGFFNDRIISPSMMRAMAICYIGPRNSPDLSKNSYISPILTPSTLLAEYPPVYLLCGERDPFSDDTLIFAGRLREAKTAKKAEALAKQSKFGEGLRMSSSRATARDPILDQNEEDWVTMRFIEGWSHGFMQMVILLPKVKQFFDLTADWAIDSFEKGSDIGVAFKPATEARSIVLDMGQDSTASEKEDEALSFAPRRRGSRPSSPVPPGNLRESLKRDIQSRHTSASNQSSASASDATSASSTSATSLGSSRARRNSPSDPTKSGPLQRVLQEEMDGVAAPRVRRASDSTSPARAVAAIERRASDLAENAVAASAFVEAHDLLKRRREAAVADLGSSAVASSESE